MKHFVWELGYLKEKNGHDTAKDDTEQYFRDRKNRLDKAENRAKKHRGRPAKDF